MDYKYYKHYCDDIENVENFDKAAADNFVGWHCHHRLETHNSDGVRRIVDISHKELIALGMYYHRPAEELIFMTTKEHVMLHCKGKYHTEEEKKKMREAWDYNKHFTEETRKKISEAGKGRQSPMKGKTPWNKGKNNVYTKETRKKMAEAAKVRNKGKHWYNNGKENKFCYECPDGFVSGRLK